MTLIEKLEAATGPDRELDAEIALATGWEFDPGFLTMPWTTPDGQISMFLPSNFTGSIDAALTLVPEGWAWNVWRIGYEFLQGAADLWIPSKYSKGLPKERFRVEAKTAPLALCIAALRARGVK